MTTLVWQVRDRTRERDEALAAVARVRALHTPDPIYPELCHVCSAAQFPFESDLHEPLPCPTLRALDGTP